MPGPGDIGSAFFKMLVGKRVPVAVFEKRMQICEKCPNLQNTITCGLCGCLVIEKTDLANEECPDNPPKWLKYE